VSTVSSAPKRSRFVENLTALFGVQIANYVIPLITIPYLTRVLKPEGWGNMAFVQSLGLILVTVMEYGFTLSAARDVAIHRDNPQFLKEQIGAVTVAKLFLLVIAAAIALIAFESVPFLRNHPAMFLAGLIWAIAQGSSPQWLYQGLENMRISSLIDVCWKACGIAALFLFVKNSAGAPLALAIYAAASVGSSATLYSMALIQHGVVMPATADVRRSLKEGLSVFVLQISVSMYTTANAFVLGLLAPKYEVGLYAGAERVSKSLLGLLGPLNQALYPRMNANVHLDRGAASRLVRRGFYGLLAITLTVSTIAYFAAPTIVHLFLGRNYSSSISVLRIMVALLPIVGASNMLGIQWMLPLRMDKAFSTIIVAGGALNILLASILARRMFARGMAVSAVCAELLVTFGCLFYLSWKRQNPLGRIELPSEREISAEFIP
jgi:polysaccharide transporter, PST family